MSILKVVKPLVPISIRRWIREQQRRLSRWPPPRFGSLRRLQPISRVFGFDRGLCIDRYYIDQFLSAHASDTQGRVLEIGDGTYTRKYGGDRVTKSDVLHAVEGNPKATIVADLTSAGHIPSNTFDCIICTQTLQFIYDEVIGDCTFEWWEFSDKPLNDGIIPGDEQWHDVTSEVIADGCCVSGWDRRVGSCPGWAATSFTDDPFRYPGRIPMPGDRPVGWNHDVAVVIFSTPGCTACKHSAMVGIISINYNWPDVTSDVEVIEDIDTEYW